MIQQFKGQYEFLSNFYLCPIEYEGDIYPSAENLYQSFKNREQKDQFLTLTPAEAKKLGGKVKLIDTWEIDKLDIMYMVVKLKFEQNPILKQKLVATVPHQLVEGNTWKDNFWGQDLNSKEKGLNHLGKILMDLRTQFAPRKFPGIQ